jgi:hypothetical protein
MKFSIRALPKRVSLDKHADIFIFPALFCWYKKLGKFRLFTVGIGILRARFCIMFVYGPAIKIKDFDEWRKEQPK